MLKYFVKSNKGGKNMEFNKDTLIGDLLKAAPDKLNA